MHPTVCAVVVTYNSQKDILDCLKSLKDQNYPKLSKIIVVDSASSDRTVELIKQNTFEKLILEASPKNLYFAGGNNEGIKIAIQNYSPDYIALLNPDAYADKNWISSMVKIAESDLKVGIVGAKTLFWDNQNAGLLNSCGLVFDGFMQAYDRGFMEEDIGQYNKTEEIVAVSGCNMLLRVSMLNQTGSFYEKMQMYLEDLELCLRAKKHGWKVIYTSDSTVGHKYMQSTSQNISVRKKRKILKNWLLIALRHYSYKSKLAMVKKVLKGIF
jgi:hypothetical protein